MRKALAAAVAGILLVPGSLLADDAVPPAPGPQPSTAPAAAPQGDGAAAAQQAAPQPAQDQHAQEQSKQPAPVVKAASPQPAKEPKKQRKAHAAASGSVTIQNFAFNPGTVNVNTGDTVTWTNRDSSPHTATGNGGSFNTGTLKKGQSASHTFAKPGRFAYICAIHPNMKGTVVVAGAAASSPSSAGSSSGSGSGSASGAGSGQSSPSASPAQSSSSQGPTLPNTGLQVGVVALLGALFTLFGVVLRRVGSRG